MTDHQEALRLIAAREPLRAWGPGVVDLPWADPVFSERMLRVHLDQSHELASRRLDTIVRQVDRMVEWLGLDAIAAGVARMGSIAPALSLLDLTCGPGLVAREFGSRGVSVTGVDVSPAAIRHAVEITAGLPCIFMESDVREVPLPVAEFDAAIYLYGQSGVTRPDDLREILARVRRSLRPGAPLLLEVRDAAMVDRRPASSWWAGGDSLFSADHHVVMTERGWDADANATVQRHYVLDVETGELSVYGVTERAFEQAELAGVLSDAGFPIVELHPGWDGLAFEESPNWLLAIGR